MKRNTLKEDVKKEIINTIDRTNCKTLNNSRVDEFIKRISETKLLCTEIMSKVNKNAIYMYQNINIINLNNFMKIYLDEQKIGYFTDSKNLFLNEIYKIEYYGIEFVLFLSYEFNSFKIESNDFFIEPYVFVSNKLFVELVSENEIVWKKEYEFDYPEDIYLDKIKNLEVEVRPHFQSRTYEIAVFENGYSLSANTSYNLNDVFKYILDVLVDENFISKNEDLKITFKKKKELLENVEVSSDFVYNNVVIGSFRKKDTLCKYEITFKLKGISRYVKVFVYLTEDERKMMGKIENYISPEKQLIRIDMKSSVYFGNEFNIFNLCYCSGTDNANMYIKIKKGRKDIKEDRYIEYILSRLLNMEPIVIDISDKKLPFPNVIYFKNILKVIKKDEELKDVKVFDIDYEDIIYIENKLCILKKYIVIVDGIVYKVELLSELMQGVLKYLDCSINLPIILSENVKINYKEINSARNIDALVYSNHLHNRKHLDNMTELYVRLSIIRSYILRNCKEYFNNIGICTIGNLNNLKSCIERTLKVRNELNLCDLINIENKDLSIRLSDKLTFGSDDEYYDAQKVNLYVDKYFVGSKFIEKSRSLELCISELEEKQSLLEIYVDSKDIAFIESLDDIFYNHYEKKIICRKLDREDELTSSYIDAIFSIYND